MPRLAKKISTPRRYYLGIDPGRRGALVALDASGKVFHRAKMPRTPGDLWLSLCDLRIKMAEANPLEPVITALLEKVRTRPGEGARGAFTFGQGFGQLQMALIASEIKFTEVSPQKWIAGLGIPKRAKHTKKRMRALTKGKNKGKMVEQAYGGETDAEWKNRLKDEAQKRFPGHRITLVDADAFLIAEYCRLRGEAR
jgi:hypothetical protein